ncbi:MAG: N-acetyl-gamma-glutamyl-phosphate reductase [Clostridia bacterium]|nr:N-acetyl-gamma-glutamyl-phosphate reductase [Clostridia bacterium]
MKKIFIDGSAGTTGLRIHERLGKRDDINLVTLSDEKRKDPEARKEAINSSDVTFLCLPDDAAREAVAMTENPDTVIIDTSTAHRTEPEFAYGFPELSDKLLNKIKTSKRIAVPGCHAGGFIALVYPLVKAGLISPDASLFCHSITGYSGGGKKMIAEYESEELDVLLTAPRQYGLSQTHKHLKEMKAISGINSFPIFTPVVSNFYSGMTVTVPLFKEMVNGSVNDIKDVYRSLYNTPIVKFSECASDNGFVSGASHSGLDSMTVAVDGNEDRILLIAQYDNLGKGASGAAVECLNISLGVDPATGLEL